MWNCSSSLLAKFLAHVMHSSVLGVSAQAALLSRFQTAERFEEDATLSEDSESRLRFFDREPTEEPSKTSCVVVSGRRLNP